MLKKEHLEFLLQILLAKNPQGSPFVSVGVEEARVAAETLDELRKQLEATSSA